MVTKGELRLREENLDSKKDRINELETYLDTKIPSDEYVRFKIGGNNRSLWVKDPDGNLLEITKTNGGK